MAARRPDLDQPRPAPALLEDPGAWQMSLGERAALVGMLAQTRPRLAIEVGTAEGGSLQRIAAYADHVHSFDLVEPKPEIRALPNVTLHTGDSHALLPQLLQELAASGINVDFVLVDGDHSAEGVAQDMRDLLSSPAIGRTLILMHDSANEEVRRGLKAVDYDAEPKVRYADLDFVMGIRLLSGPFAGELWGGLGAVVVDAESPRAEGEPIAPVHIQETQPLVVAGLRDTPDELERLRTRLAVIEGSRSWRLTEPVRRAARLLRR